MQFHSSTHSSCSIFTSFFIFLCSMFLTGVTFADCGSLDVPWPSDVIIFQIDTTQCGVILLAPSGVPMKSLVVELQGEEDDEIEIPPGFQGEEDDEIEIPPGLTAPGGTATTYGITAG